MFSGGGKLNRFLLHFLRIVGKWLPFPPYDGAWELRCFADALLPLAITGRAERF